MPEKVEQNWIYEIICFCFRLLSCLGTGQQHKVRYISLLFICFIKFQFCHLLSMNLSESICFCFVSYITLVQTSTFGSCNCFLGYLSSKTLWSQLMFISTLFAATNQTIFDMVAIKLQHFSTLFTIFKAINLKEPWKRWSLFLHTVENKVAEKG